MDFGHFDVERFKQYVRKQGNGCWMWAAGFSGNGIPAFSLHGKSVAAHRFAYAAFCGKVPADMKVVNTCETPGCVNPDHLKVVGMSDLLRERQAGNAGRTHCRQGHEFTPENTRVNSRGSRVCKTCERERMRTRRNLALIARGSIMDSAELDKVG